MYTYYYLPKNIVSRLPICLRTEAEQSIEDTMLPLNGWTRMMEDGWKLWLPRYRVVHESSYDSLQYW